MGLFDQLKNVMSSNDLAEKAGGMAKRGLSELADKSGEGLQKVGNKLNEVGENVRDSRIKAPWPDSNHHYQSAYDPRGNAYVESASYDHQPDAPVWRLVPKHMETR